MSHIKSQKKAMRMGIDVGLACDSPNHDAKLVSSSILVKHFPSQYNSHNEAHQVVTCNEATEPDSRLLIQIVAWRGELLHGQADVDHQSVRITPVSVRKACRFPRKLATSAYEIELQFASIYSIG